MPAEKRKEPERKPYLKLFSKPWLDGSLRFDCDSAERGLWADLMAMANESRNRGVIQANPTTPYPHSWIATKLNVPLDFFESTLTKFIEQGRILENSTGITLIWFDWYQNELYTKPGRPPKHPPEQLPLDPKLGEYSKAFTAAIDKMRKKLGRDPTIAETREIQESVRRKVYGEEGEA